jgi:paraquat-inducible protein B
MHSCRYEAYAVLDHVQANMQQDINKLVYQMKNELDQIADAQSAQLASTQHQLRLGKELSTAQEANIALGEQMKLSSASIAAELDSAKTAAGRVSKKLDKVNQALTRVEAASAVLSSVFAIIAIPCQLAGQLHLRVLALFAMPAIVLSFWKPRRYPYSLMALYGMFHILPP